MRGGYKIEKAIKMCTNARQKRQSKAHTYTHIHTQNPDFICAADAGI